MQSSWADTHPGKNAGRRDKGKIWKAAREKQLVREGQTDCCLLSGDRGARVGTAEDKCPEMGPPPPHNTPLRASGQAARVPVLCCGTSLSGPRLPSVLNELLSCLIPWGSEKQRSWFCVLCCVQW